MVYGVGDSLHLLFAKSLSATRKVDINLRMIEFFHGYSIIVMATALSNDFLFELLSQVRRIS